jgi:ABC-2 type transport system permease protein
MKRVIHKGFFLEMLRQLRVKGLVSVFLLAGINLITFASFVTRNPLEDPYSHVSAQEMALPMLLFLYIIIPIMVFGAYRWMNKRAQSDFYHAIPLTRLQLYGSASAAILLWVVIALSSFCAVRAVLYAVFGLPYNYLLYLCVFLNMLIAAVEILAAFSLGSALSGTRFVTFFSGLVILFLPRALLTAFWILVEADGASAVPFSALPFFLNPTFHIAATPIHSIVFGADFANVPAMLYSLLYACALLTLGGFAFYRRKSEAAEIPYSSGVLQTIVRICFGLLPLAGLTVLLNLRYRYGCDDYAGFMVPFEMMLPLAVTSILFSFVFYCLYELISSRKMLSVARAMKFYPLCLIIAAFLIFVPAGIGKQRLQPQVSADEIRSYRINRESTLLMPYFPTKSNSYSSLVLSEHRFTDDAGKKMIEQFSKAKTSGRSYPSLSTEWITVRDGGLFGKVVRIPDDRFGDQLLRSCLDDPALIDELCAFPGGHIWFECEGLTPAEARAVGRLFEEEYRSLSVEQRKALINGKIAGTTLSDSDRTSTTALSIMLYGCKGTANYTMSYAINEHTPKAAEAYLSILNDRNGEKSRAALCAYVRWMETGSGTDYLDSLYIGWEVISDSVWVYSDRERHATPKDANPELYRILKALSEAPFSTDAENCITVRTRDMHGGTYDFVYAAGFEIPEDCREELLTLAYASRIN